MTSYFYDGSHATSARRCLLRMQYRSPAAPGPPSACDVIGLLYALQFLIHSTFILVQMMTTSSRNSVIVFCTLCTA